MLDEFLTKLAAHTGIKLTPAQFGKIAREALEAAEKQNKVEAAEKAKQEKATK